MAKNIGVESKRAALANFWAIRADFMERQAVLLFRDAGEARQNAKVATALADDAVEQLFETLTAKKDGGDVKTVVDPEGGTGKVN